MWRPRPKFKVSFYLYFCCFWINVTQINFENIKRKIQRIISDSRFQLKSWFNVDARAPSIPLLNFPFNISKQPLQCVKKKKKTQNTCNNSYIFKEIKQIHRASKETSHFIRASLTEIHYIKSDHLTNVYLQLLMNDWNRRELSNMLVMLV